MSTPLVMLALAGASPALAHHDTAVQQVGSGGSGEVGSRMLDEDGPRLDARAAFAWQTFGRLRQGTARYSDAEPTVTVERYTVSVGLRLATRTRLDLALPTGRVRGLETGPMGIGDLAAKVSQRLGPARVGVFATAPTGRYTVDAVSSVVELQPDDKGQIGIVTYDARASLGSGAWRAGLAAGIEGRRGPVVLDLSSTLTRPLGETPDGILWGADATAMASASLRLLAERLSIGAGLLGQLHTADRVLGEQPTDSTEEVFLRTSRRRSLAVVGTVAGRLTKGLACGTQARVPMTQWVQGVQLAESFTVSGQCTVAHGLGKKPAAS